MGFFDRFRFAGRLVAGNDTRSGPCAAVADELEAIRLINEGNALENQGHIDEAMKRYQTALEQQPKLARAHLNIGNILQKKNNAEAALKSFDAAILLNPDYAAPHYNKGNLLHDMELLDRAADCFSRAIELQPGLAEAHNNLGLVYRDLGQYERAVACYRQALEIKPDLAVAHSNLGNALQLLGQLDAAETCCRHALKLGPGTAMMHFNLGNVFQAQGKGSEAIASYRSAIAINPEFADALSNLGNVFDACEQIDAAIECYGRALKINPNLAGAHNNLGTVLSHGQMDRALSCFRRALEIKPDFSEAHSNLLFNLSHSGSAEAASLFAEHCAFAEQFETPFITTWPQHTNTPEPNRCLQIGLVSADLRNHAVAHFVEPVLEKLACCPELTLHVYYNNTIEDAISSRMRGYLPRWNRVSALSDNALAQKIMDDGIDILIDLSGHTAKNRLLTFARKPAPIQASWIGYPGTTGLLAMDYYVADKYFLPPGLFDSQFSEKIAYLPASTPFLPVDNSPPANALPAISHGHMTFGSFNRPSKLNRPVIALWSTLLRALPDSRLVLGSMPPDNKSDTLLDWFSEEGIDRERISRYPRTGMLAYLELHYLVDICLDTFPYSGGTTTNHALWMGVPTLTLAGTTPSGRGGAANLAYLGLESFVANDAAEFVQKGLAWAGDLPALAALRGSLRERFEQSPVRRPEIVAAGLEETLRIMWQRWCSGLPPETFEAHRK